MTFCCIELNFGPKSGENMVKETEWSLYQIKVIFEISNLENILSARVTVIINYNGSYSLSNSVSSCPYTC